VQRHQPAALPCRRPVHRAEHGDLGVVPGLNHTAGDDSRVQIGTPTGLRHARILRQGREDARFQLGGVCDDEFPAVVGNHGAAYLFG